MRVLLLIYLLLTLGLNMRNLWASSRIPLADLLLNILRRHS